MTTASPAKRRITVLVMGVSGSGKSTVAAGIASALGLHFIDADGLHAPGSVAKMHAGIALQGEDRWPWLDRVGACLADAQQWPQGLAMACSALKRAYRDRIRDAAPGVRFIFLDGPADLVGRRMAERSEHYMPSALLESQFRTLEPPGRRRDRRAARRHRARGERNCQPNRACPAAGSVNWRSCANSSRQPWLHDSRVSFRWCRRPSANAASSISRARSAASIS